MKKLIVSALLASAFAFAAPAVANPNDGDQPPGCAPSGNQPDKCDGDVNNGGAGGAGGNATNNTSVEQTTVVGVVNTSSNTNTNTNTTTNTATNTATGGNASAEGGAGGNAASSSSSGGNSFSNVTNYKRAHRVAPQAYAPTVITGACQASTTGGISTPFGGVSLGGTRGDKWCQLKTLAEQFSAWGRVDVACHLLSQDRRVAMALSATGVGCPAYQAPQAPEVPVARTYIAPPQPERG